MSIDSSDSTRTADTGTDELVETTEVVEQDAVAMAATEVKSELQQAIETRALELEILGWYRSGHANQGTHCLRQESGKGRKWNKQFRQQIISLSDQYLHPDGYCDYVVMLEAVDADPWPKLQAKAKAHLERGEFEEAEGIYWSRVPFGSKLMEDKEKRVIPDDQLLACGRACRTKGDFENAKKAYGMLKEAPVSAEANEIVIWLLENDHLADAGEFAVNWEVTKFQSRFEQAAQESLEGGQLMEAYQCYRAARRDIHNDAEVRDGLAALARYELARERQKTISFRADSREESFRKTWDSAMAKREGGVGEEKEYFWAHPYQISNLFTNPKGVKRARIRREVIQEIGTPDEVLELIMHEQELGFCPPEYIIELLQKVGSAHPGYRQRMLDCIDGELQTANNELRGIGRTGMPDLLGKKEENVKEAKETLQEVQRLCEMEGVNPPVFLLAKLARLYQVVGDNDAAQRLIDKHGQSLIQEMGTAEVVKEPQEGHELVMSGMRRYGTEKLKRQIPRGKFVNVSASVSLEKDFYQMANVGDVIPLFHTRARKELAAVHEQVMLQKDTQTVTKPELIEPKYMRAVVRAYELIKSEGVDVPAEEQAMLDVLIPIHAANEEAEDRARDKRMQQWEESRRIKPIEGNRTEVLRELKRKIPRGNLSVALEQFKLAECAVSVDDIRVQLRRRVKKEIGAVLEQMRMEKERSTGEEGAKTRWGNETAHERWNEKTEASVEGYELLDESSLPDDEEQKLSDLAVSHQQAFGDAFEKNRDHHWGATKRAAEVAKKIYKCLAALELKKTPAE